MDSGRDGLIRRTESSNKKRRGAPCEKVGSDERGGQGKGGLRNLLRAAGFGPAEGPVPRYTAASGAGGRRGNQLHAADSLIPPWLSPLSSAPIGPTRGLRGPEASRGPLGRASRASGGPPGPSTNDPLLHPRKEASIIIYEYTKHYIMIRYIIHNHI